MIVGHFAASSEGYYLRNIHGIARHTGRGSDIYFDMSYVCQDVAYTFHLTLSISSYFSFSLHPLHADQGPSSHRGWLVGWLARLFAHAHRGLSR